MTTITLTLLVLAVGAVIAFVVNRFLVRRIEEAERMERLDKEYD
jgi:HAMP domain-containing protein